MSLIFCDAAMMLLTDDDEDIVLPGLIEVKPNTPLIRRHIRRGKSVI